MTEMVITRGADGAITGVTERHQKGWLKFWKLLQELTDEVCVYVEFYFPRNPKLHKLFFKRLHNVFKMQELFAEFDDFRLWVTVQAGYCNFVPGKDGKLCAIPKSIRYSKMDDLEFEAYFEAVMKGLWEGDTHRILWPHLSADQSWEMMGIAMNGR
jgi:hypothetical protein